MTEFKFGTWYSIETYPNDKSNVLIYDDGFFTVANRDICNCKETNPLSKGCPQFPYHWWEPSTGEIFEGNLNPTHWMPLPPPPVTDNG